MVKRYCDFCGTEIQNGVIQLDVDERRHHHLVGKRTIELCEKCGEELFDKICPNWREEKEESERKAEERKAEHEKKKIENGFHVRNGFN